MILLYAIGACPPIVVGFELTEEWNPVKPARVIRSTEPGMRGVTQTWLYVGGGRGTPSGLNDLGFVSSAIVLTVSS